MKSLKMLAASKIPHTVDISKLHEHIQYIIKMTLAFDTYFTNEHIEDFSEIAYKQFRDHIMYEALYFYVCEMFDRSNDEFRRMSASIICYFRDTKRYNQIGDAIITRDNVLSAFCSNNVDFAKDIITLYGCNKYCGEFNVVDFKALINVRAFDSLKYLDKHGFELCKYVFEKDYDNADENDLELCDCLYSIDKFEHCEVFVTLLSVKMIEFLHSRGYNFITGFNTGVDMIVGNDFDIYCAAICRGFYTKDVYASLDVIKVDSVIKLIEIGVLSKLDFITVCEDRLFGCYLPNRIGVWKHEDALKLLLYAFEGTVSIWDTCIKNKYCNIIMAFYKLGYFTVTERSDLRLQ